MKPGEIFAIVAIAVSALALAISIVALNHNTDTDIGTALACEQIAGVVVCVER